MHNKFEAQTCPENPHYLDLEFRQILAVIKQFIPYVDSNSHLSLYRSWLEKLSSTTSDKKERNKYLVELARQIREDRVFPPFDQRPPIGHLKTFPEIDCRDVGVHLNYPNIAYLDSDNLPEPLSSVNSNAVWKKTSPTYPFDIGTQYIPQGMNLHSHNKRSILGEVQRNDNQFVTKNKDRDGVHEDSSWCDLTDTSATSIAVNPMGRGDATEKPVAVGTGKASNENAEQIKLTETDGVEHDDVIDITSKSMDKLDPKFPLKDTHFICADWKKTIESLQMRLTETLSQNNELKSMIQALKAKLNYETSNKEQNELMQRRNVEEHVKEVEYLKKSHSEQSRKMQESFEFQIDQLQENYKLKIEEIKADSEMRLREQKLEYEEDKREKDKEICRLSDIIQQQCIRMSNEIVALRKQIESSLSNNNSKHSIVPEEKVFVLQKCVSKMDKLFHKSEKDYMKQIEKLRQELELKDKVAQIQLKTQRAELISRTNADRQNQIEDVVNNLEVKYIKMLEYHENQVSESKRQDEEKIEYLKDLLKKNNITFLV